MMMNSLQFNGLMQLRKVSNITNSSEPKAIHSRVFIGNLNTFTLTKDDVETVFKRYGRIIGISMHKGYAFVQYTNEHEARNSVSGEDQRVYANQQIDVNIASEPKPNRPSRKKPQGAGAEWDYYYNVPIIPGRCPLPIALSLKRPRPDLAPSLISPPGMLPTKRRGLVPVGIGAASLMNGHPGLLGSRLTRPKARSGLPVRVHQNSPRNNESPDILICGSCKEMFPSIDELTTHKQAGCPVKSTCKCTSNDDNHNDRPVVMICASCSAEFSSCWELCQHCQSEHGLAIYDDSKFPGSSSSDTASQTSQSHVNDHNIASNGGTMAAPTADISALYDPEEVEQLSMVNGQKDKEESVSVDAERTLDISDSPVDSTITSNGVELQDSTDKKNPSDIPVL